VEPVGTPPLDSQYGRFPPRGPSGWFPRFIGKTKHSDFLPPLPNCFVSFARRYRRCALRFAHTALRRYQLRARDCSPESPTGFIDGYDRISQVPGGPYYERALLFDSG
jgi:hypothetical protein